MDKQMEAYVRVSPNNMEVQLQKVARPEPKTDQALIKIEAFGVGIHDRYFIPMDARFPYIIGSEGAGIVVETGRDVSKFTKGDRVVFTTVLQPEGGTWAEYAVANASHLVPLPEDLSFEKAATIPIAGGTALECMRELSLQKGDFLFIAGASGAIGTFVIQMAAQKGIRVCGSASKKNHDYMLSLGAEKAVDYHDSNWKEEVISWSQGGVGKALAIQPRTGTDSIKVVKDSGELITVSGDAQTVTPERSITVRQMGHGTDAAMRMAQLADDISSGRIKVVIEKEFPFDQALDALQKTETRHARGKLVVRGYTG